MPQLGVLATIPLEGKAVRFAGKEHLRGAHSPMTFKKNIGRGLAKYVKTVDEYKDMILREFCFSQVPKQEHWFVLLCYNRILEASVGAQYVQVITETES